MRILALLALMPLSASWAVESTSLAMASKFVSTPVQQTVQQDEAVSAISKMEERNSSFKNLLIEADIVVSRAGKDDVPLVAQYSAAGSDYRFKINYGAYDVLDLSVRSKEAILWLPRKDTFCKGDREHMADIPNDLRFVGLAGDAKGLILPSCWANGADKRRLQKSGGKTYVNVLKGSSILRRFTLVRVDGEIVVEKVVFFEDDKPMSAISYSGHSLVNGLYLPSRVDFYTSETTRLTLSVKKVQVNSAKDPRLSPYISEAKLAEAPLPLANVLASGALFE
jgi:hypothetical protein